MLSASNKVVCLPAFAAFVVLMVSCGGLPVPDVDAAASGDAADPGDSAEADVPGIPDDRNFSSPEGVLVWNNRVFVTNANFAYQGSQLQYGTGFVTVIDRTAATVVNIIPLPFQNPQEMVVHGDRVWVLCSGVTAWDAENFLVVSKTSGGLAAIDLVGADVADGPVVAIPIPTAEGSLVGYPSGMVVSGNEAWIASGTTAALFMVDLDSGEVVRGGADPVMLAEEVAQNTTVVGQGPNGLLTIGLFNDDRVFLFDPVTRKVVDGPWPAAEVGLHGVIDGILDIENDGTSIYLLLGLANQVIDFDRDAGPAAGVGTLASGLLTPNRMKMRGSALHVVNSGDNSLAVINTGTGDSEKFGLPVNCNPWDIDTAPGEATAKAWISCLKSNSVVVVDTADGSFTEVQ